MANPNLPPTEAYTLAEVASEWGCNETKLIDFYRSDMLDIQVYVDNAYTIDRDALFVADKVVKIPIDGLHMLFKRDLIKVIEANGEKSKSHTIRHVYDEIADGDAQDFGSNNWPYELITPINLNSAALRISHEEVQRFQEHYDLYEPNTETFTTLPDAPPKKEENLLRTIGGLSLILANQGREWGTPQKPKVSAISDAIQQLASNLDVSSHGQSNSTLAKVIRDAIKLFRDE